MRSINAIYNPPPMHWVGDGFPVRTLFSYDRFGAGKVSPFLMLDYAAGVEFPSADQPRGVGAHPHKGFETVTIVYEGELEHRDSTGSGGLIGPGDVQWMTAGSGIVHEEFHSRDFSERGGIISMAQLWVNLPASDKNTPPNYQTIMNNDIPRIPLDNIGSFVRVIAGAFSGVKGPARTFTPINLWDVVLKEGSTSCFTVPGDHNLMIAVLEGSVRGDEQQSAGAASLIGFSQDGEEFILGAEKSSRLLLMSGAPIDEPVVGYGPFVMNTQGEIRQAMLDFQQGKFGGLQGS